MVSESALRGYVLEEILARLLSRSGYRLLVKASQDAAALRDGRHGLLVRGRGSDHQADALGDCSSRPLSRFHFACSSKRNLEAGQPG
jgi:hypothetical protein